MEDRTGGEGSNSFGMLLNGVIDISSTSLIGREDMIREWSTIYNSVILPSRNKGWKDFVMAMHDYLRVKKSRPFKAGGWNFFLSLIDSKGCNCICSSVFILLAAASVGLFPNKVIGTYVESHIFISSPDLLEFFETTTSCGRGWVKLEQILPTIGLSGDDQVLTITSPSQLLTIYTFSSVDHSNIAVQYMEKYPDTMNPHWLLWNIGRSSSDRVAGDASKLIYFLQYSKLSNSFKGVIVETVRYLARNKGLYSHQAIVDNLMRVIHAMSRDITDDKARANILNELVRYHHI